MRPFIWIVAALVLITPAPAQQTYRTDNFEVNSPSKALSKEVGDLAEVYRDKLNRYWTGKPLKNWSSHCPITVRVGTVGAGGETRFKFDRGEVYGWNMTIQGDRERILDSSLPHEINHTIFATYFRGPLPRLLDEGAASLFEDVSEQSKYVKLHQEEE